MPRWARLLSCSFTGLLLSFSGFLVAVYWWEGGPGYWSGLLGFLSTSAFWYLVLLFGLLAFAGLVMARIAVRLYDVAVPTAGFLTSGLMALVYAAFLIANHAEDWGGLVLSLRKTWLAACVFAVPFAFSGAFAAWLWDRLD